MEKAKVHITGLGSVTACGLTPKDLFQSCLEERSAIQNGEGRISDTLFEKLHQNHPEVSPNLKAQVFGREAIAQAISQAGWKNLSNTGFLLGTTTGQVSSWEDSLQEHLDGKRTVDALMPTFQRESLGLLLQDLGQHFQLSGPTALLSTACSASTHAIGIAADWIRQGKVDRCLVGGIETLCDLTLKGFGGFQLTSEKIARPFDRDRTGINLSEGAAFLCLEKSDSGLASVLGSGIANDAHHMTAPHPEGRGSAQAIKMALAQANITGDQIDWVHAHGTGSLHNDRAESIAISQVIGTQTPVSSTKGIHGHALAASGAIETILCVKAMENNVALGTLGLESPEDDMKANLLKDHQETPLNFVLKNTLGFGGTNGALVLGRGA